MKEELYALSNPEIVRSLGERFKEYRLRMGKTQKDIAEFTGLSLFTVSSFETGQGTGITLVNFLKLLRSIDALEEIDRVLPTLPESPRLLFESQKRKPKRVRNHGK